MDKITLLKDINGNLVYPKILSESIPDKAINKTLLNSDVTSIFDGLISREFLSRSGESAQNAFETGIYSWCTSGGPGNISGAFTLIVLRTKDADSNGFYSIYQTAIAREDVPNNYEHGVYSRLILRNDSSNVTTYTKWIEISSRLVRDSLNTEVLRALAAEKANATSISSLSSGKVDKTTTVNGHALSGNVTVTKSDLVIENVDNTSDINKPISKATQSALNLKADLESPALTGTPTAPTATEGTSTTQLATTAFVTSADNKKVDKTTTINGHALSGNITVTKGDVGLGSVDNTADSDKSVKHATSADNDGSGNNIVKTYATITNLTAETSRAKSAEETNASNLSNEITRAKAAESTLQTSVSKNKSAIDILNGTSDVEGSVKKAIKDVVGAAPEALNTLGEIATELTNHESAAAAISTAITNETIRAKAAEGTNTTAINNEVSRAKGAEKTLTDSVNTEVTRAKAAEKLNADAIVAINNILSNRLTYKEV